MSQIMKFAIMNHYFKVISITAMGILVNSYRIQLVPSHLVPKTKSYRFYKNVN